MANLLSNVLKINSIKCEVGCDKCFAKIHLNLCEMNDQAKEQAHALVNAGIGDKKQAVKEFIEVLEECLATNSVEDGFNYDYLDYSGTIQTIDNLFTELYGVDE